MVTREKRSRFFGLAGVLLGMLVAAAAVGGARAWAQTATSPGCTLKRQVFTCDRAQFRQALTSARTARIETRSKDRMAAAKLRDLTVAIGKTAPQPGETADLVFSLIPLDTDGVLIGPAGTELAVLRVYSGAVDGGGQGNLLWAETLFGQPDMSWPAVVQAVIDQFRAGFKP